MKKSALTIVLLSIVMMLKAQTVFITSAKITFQKKTNQKQQLAENDWLSDDAKDKMSKYRTSDWEYNFNDSTSLYRAKPKESLNDSQFFFIAGDNTSEMFTDFGKKTRTLRKPINGEDFILKDTIPRLKWKVMHDIRKIAGYDCRNYGIDLVDGYHRLCRNRFYVFSRCCFFWCVHGDFISGTFSLDS